MTEVALEMVAADFGVMCLPEWSIKNFKRTDGLVFKRITPSGLIRSHYVVVEKENRDKQHVEDFIEKFKYESW